MAKDKEVKKEKKTKKIKSSELAAALGDTTNTSTDIILTSTPTKDKSRGSIEPDEEDFYESRLAAQAPFAKPLANKKLNKKVLKTIKKGIHSRFFNANDSITSKRTSKRSKRGRQSSTKRRKRVFTVN